MNRLYTKDATGVAPNGRWYAGDINALQDAVAALSDFAQAIGLGTLQIGDSGIQLLKYATGEARLSAALRTDGILRGLGGMYAGAFTTAQRDAIPAGSRPYGLVILNTTTNRLEWNGGTDAAPSWQAVGLDGAGAPPTQAVPTGATFEWPGAAAPTGYLLCQGQAVSRTTYAALYAALGGSGSPYGQGDGSTTFNLPDFRGRVAVGKNTGTFAALGATGGEETHALLVAEMPSHDHGGAVSSVSAGTPAGTIDSISAGTPNGTISAVSAGTPAGSINSVSAGTPAGTINSVSAGTPAGSVSVAAAGAHTHDVPVNETGGIADAGGVSATSTSSTLYHYTASSAGSHAHSASFSGSAMAGHSHSFTGSAMGGHSHTFTGSALGTHTHTFTGTALAAHNHTFTGAALAAHSHTITAQGGGGAHNNLQPYLVINKIIKT